MSPPSTTAHVHEPAAVQESTPSAAAAVAAAAAATNNAATAVTTSAAGAAASSAVAAAAASVPRKRRRRAPVTGATEDCFACRKRQTKCDRRRPYCSQCIDLGKECSGYRTTLTWGVGVASRGKLRGLSLPIAKAASTAAAIAGSSGAPRSPLDTRAPPSASSGDASCGVRSGLPTVSEAAGGESHDQSPPTNPSVIGGGSTGEYGRFDATSPIPIPASTLSHLGWHVAGYGEQGGEGFASHGKMERHAFHAGHLQKLHTSLGAAAYGLAAAYDDTGLSASAGSLSAYSDSEFSSPSDFPQTPDDFGFVDARFSTPYGSLFAEPMSSTESLGFIPRSFPSSNGGGGGGNGDDNMSSSLSSDQSTTATAQEFAEANALHGGHYGPSPFAEAIYEGGVEATAPCSSPHRAYPHYQQMDILLAEASSSPHSAVRAAEVANTLAIPPSILQGPVYSLSPRMQYLLDYYDKAICPVLVAFDSPTNPYRMHVIPMAIWNEGLQNALAALAVNNIRMRGGTEARRLGWEDGSSVLPDHAYSRVTPQELRDIHGEPTAEELRYKAASIHLLNAQLADPARAKDDSVLATLLVLCLFHVCDSGFTKFRTQLAGVQKLLSLRDRSERSHFVGWIEMFFTWFDVMTACVNDRETEIRGDSFDMLNFSANLGALEHHAGCEGRLFKLIARLGRLNLLSQNRPVRQRPPDTTSTTPRPSPRPPLRRARDYYSLSYDSIDGNGWGFAVESPSSPLSSPLPSPAPFGSTTFLPRFDDPRHEFWAEWSEVRRRLQEWEFITMPGNKLSPSSLTAAEAAALLDPSQRDMLHISESFRYSALLYVERLAYPKLPSAALNFQNLVAQSLFHISHLGITSCVNKFLLWPLFVTGTECVDENHRAIVRQRCVEIQRESGFFNNLSGLEVLEKFWRGDDDDEGGDGSSTPRQNTQAFKWRRAMDRIDGEYVIV